MGTLNVKAVTALIRAAVPGHTVDGDGLRLSINKAGIAYWALRVRVAGKDYERTIGRADAIGLADAREKARVLRAELKAGTAAPSRRDVPTFEAAAREHYEAIKTTFKNAKHSAQFLSSLEAYVFPVFGSKAVDLVAEGDVTEALLKIWLTKHETASRVRQRIRAVLAAAKGRGWRTTAIDWDAVAAALPKHRKAVQHMASIGWEDVPEFVTALPASPSAPAIRAALQLLITTAVRPGNIAAARWEDIDLKDALWTIPADQMKGGKEHRVPLSAGALAALKIAEMSRVTDCELVFPGRADFEGKRGPISPDTMRMAMRRMGTDATPHGFRSSFKDWSLANGYPDHLSELALAHVDQNKVRRAYARTDLLKERRVMMEAWDKYIFKISRK